MSKDLLPELLQECLAAYDAGLSPEDCLSAYPTRRRELEPLLRQALTLRVAYAPGPDEAFRKRAKESLMFAAGREVTQALSAKPDPLFVADMRIKFLRRAGSTAQEALRSVPTPNPRFVASARERFINAAGAPAQEALRAVPPPRLPFWWNTRRRLLEAASLRPQPQATRRPFGSLAFQAGLSVAVVVLAVAIAGFAFLTDQTAQPSAASEVASLERQLNDLEARYEAGQPIFTDLQTLTKRTLELAEKLNDQPAATGASKLPALIERQLAVGDKVYANVPPPPEVLQAQQQLDDQRAKLLAAAQSTAPSAPAATSTSLPATSTPAGPTATATITPVPAPLQVGQIRYGLVPNDTFGGVTWQEIRTISIRFIAPSNWQLGGVAPDATGVARLTSNAIGVGGDNAVVLVDVRNGEILGQANGQIMTLRSDSGVFINPAELVEKGGALAPVLRHILDSFQVTAAAPPTPIPTSTLSPAATATPTQTATPPPTSTPSPPATQVPSTPTQSVAPPTSTRNP